MEVSKVTRRARVLDESRGDLMNKNYYAIIPANVRYSDLPPNAKLLYGEITALANERGYCWASNSYFSDLYGVSKRSITTWINALTEKSFIHVEMIYRKGTKEIEERRLYIAPPIEKNFYTSRRNLRAPMEENFHTPIEENFQDNNTVFNNTFNNHDDDNARVRENDIYHFYQQNFGVLTPIIGQKISDWINVLNFELVKEALIRTLMNNTRSFNYAEAIMRDWKDKNIREIEQVHALDLERQSKKGSRTTQKPNQKKQDTSFSESIGLKVW